MREWAGRVCPRLSIIKYLYILPTPRAQAKKITFEELLEIGMHCNLDPFLYS